MHKFKTQNINTKSKNKIRQISNIQKSSDNLFLCKKVTNYLI